jgi:hypothetical protein
MSWYDSYIRKDCSGTCIQRQRISIRNLGQDSNFYSFIVYLTALSVAKLFSVQWEDDTNPAFFCRNWGKPQLTSDRATRFSAEIRIEQLQNLSEKRFHRTNPLGWYEWSICQWRFLALPLHQTVLLFLSTMCELLRLLSLGFEFNCELVIVYWVADIWNVLTSH